MLRNNHRNPSSDAGFWIKESFSLADIDHTKKIVHTASQFADSISHSDYIYFTNDRFAPKFAKAFAHAARLCGGKRSSF